MLSLQGALPRQLKRTEVAIERLVLALEDGLDLDVAKARLAVLRERQQHLASLLRVEEAEDPVWTDPLGEARRVLQLLSELSPDEARLPYEVLMPCVVVRVDCEPLASHYRGEVVEISWDDQGWPAFLRKAHTLWPEGRAAPSRRVRSRKKIEREKEAGKACR